MERRMEENNMRNENDRKKQFLKGYRIKTRKIHRIEAEIDEIRSMKMYPSVKSDGMPHGGGQGDLSGYAAELCEKEEKLYEEGVDQRDVLFYRYIKGLRFWEIAQKMDYSEDWIYKLHGRALQHLKIS